MITIIYSIIIITFITWIINKKIKQNICPICTGVLLTWIIFLVGIKTNIVSSTIYQLPTSILIGGSVVGIMYKLEKYIKINFILIWKIIFAILGFYTAYNLITNKWVFSILGIIIIVIITIILKKDNNKNSKLSEKQKIIQEKMKNCC